jgi:hypothetical protein
MQVKSLSVAVVLALQLAAASAAESACTLWSEPMQAGELPIATIMEASGMAAASMGDRLYHINDGNAPMFHVTDLQGGALQSVRISNFTPVDIEDLGLGPCGTATCLFVADIGDNAARRQTVQIAIIRESATLSAEMVPERVVTARYPHGPHDAEAVAIHPSGDLLLVTKARTGIGGPAQLFRLRATQLVASGEQAFESLGTIPMPTLTRQGTIPLRVVTAMDIAPGGQRFVLLTYDMGFEFSFDPAKPLPATFVEGQTHRAFPIAALVQPEAITYERDGRSVIYSTESVRGSAAPLMRQRCMD